MGKSKRRHRSRSSEIHGSVSKRLELLERELALVKRSRRDRSGSRPLSETSSHYSGASRRRSRYDSSRHSRGRTSSIADRPRDLRRSASPAQSFGETSEVQERELTQQGSDGCSPRGSESGAYTGQMDDVLIINEGIGLSEDTLQILGADPQQPKAPDFQLHEALASRWSHLLTHGHSKEETTKLHDKHPTPSNCSFLVPPKINPEVKAILSVPHATRDATHSGFQLALGTGLSALGKAFSAVLDDDQNIPKPIREKLLPHLADSGRILAGLFYEISQVRKYLISPSLHKSVKELTDKTAPGEFLFGPDLGERAKTIKSLEKAGQDLRPILGTPRATTQSIYAPGTSGRRGGRGSRPNRSSSHLNRYRPTHFRRDVREYKGPYPPKPTRQQPPPRKR